MARTKAPRAPHPADWFGWERPGVDFPFYNDEALPLWNALLLIASPLAVAIILQTVSLGGRVGTCLTVLLGTLLPFLYVSRGKIGCLVKKPQKEDVGLAFATLGLYYVYSITMGLVLSYVLHISTHSNAVLKETMDLAFWVTVFFQLFGEELIKINLFLGLLMLIYRFTHNRKLGIIVGSVCCLTLFGLAHYYTYGSLAQVLLIQGLGSIFDLYCYLKTKNILVSYAMHVMTDAIPFLMASTGVFERLEQAEEPAASLLR